MRFAASVLVALFVLHDGAVAQDQDAFQWRRGKLKETGKPYWWRPGLNPKDPEISLTEPLDAWRIGILDSGTPYLWRRDPYGGKPEVQIWRTGRLDSGAPYWWRTNAGVLQEVSLKDPYAHARGPAEHFHDEL